MVKIINKNTRTTSLTSHSAFLNLMYQLRQITRKFVKHLKKQNLTCLIQFELNKEEVTTRCPTECVQKTFANT